MKIEENYKKPEEKNEIDYENIVKVCTFSPYRKRKRSRRQTQLVLTGKVERPGKPSCSMLVDNGCEQVVVSKSYAKKLNLETKQTNLKAELWDGTLVPMTRCSNNLTIQMGEASITVRPYVVDWIAYDIILGKTWLSKANPLIDWKSNRMLLKQGQRLIALDAEACNHMVSQPSYMITSKQLKRLAKKEKSEIYHVIIKSKKENQEKTRRKPDASHHSEELRDLLCNFQEVFPKELPRGLPPKRVVQMNIELEKDSKPKMGPIYKLSRLELEEMKKQIEELQMDSYALV